MTGVACLSFGVACPGAATAATIIVTSAGESTAGDDLCSLREAVQAANGNGAVGSDCGKGDGADVIRLGALRYTLSSSGDDDTAAAGDLDVTDDVTIVGADAATTVIDGGGVDRVFDVQAVRVSLQRLTITGGRAPDGTAGANRSGPASGGQVVGERGMPGEGGGGIRSAGALTLTDAVVTLNRAGTGGQGGAGFGGAGSAGSSGTPGATGRGGRGGDGGRGGGILVTGGSVLLERTVVRDNAAGAGGVGGGAAGGNGGLATGATGQGGSGGAGFGEVGGRGGDGGGVAATGGVLRIVDSEIAGNRAGAGGGMGDGVGGFGGPAIGASGTGGDGGQGNTNSAFGSWLSGGDGGGVFATSAVDASISGSLIVGNASGAGGRGTEAAGGQGGGVTEPGRPAGRGGIAFAGPGGDGGRSGGIELWGSVENSTITGNTSGGGGAGGDATGGRGGSTPGGTSDGGSATAGNAGRGGSSGGATLPGPPTNGGSLRHGTVVFNALGSAGAAGAAVGGAPGANAAGGRPGVATAGRPGEPGRVGGVFSGAIANTIVSGNAGEQCASSVSGTGNISFPDGSCPGTNVDPMLDPLADSGGPTRTHALRVGSPALGAVPAAAGCAATDQRGITRPQGIGCDVGAHEQAPPAVSVDGIAGVTTTTATLLGRITPNLQPTTYRFEFGTSPAYGNVTPAGDLAAGGSAATVSAAISGLAAGTTYHYRLVATNADGTRASADATFATPAGGEIAAGGAATGSGPPNGGGGAGGAATGSGPGNGSGSGEQSRRPPRKADLSRVTSPITVDRRGRFTLTFTATPALVGGAALQSLEVARGRRTRIVSTRTAFTVPRTGRMTLRIELPKKSFRILRRTGGIQTRLTVTLTDAAGMTSQVNKRVALRVRSSR